MATARYQEALNVALRALERLSLNDEMAGMGQRDDDPEAIARCRYAARALTQVGEALREPAGEPGDTPVVTQSIGHIPGSKPEGLTIAPEVTERLAEAGKVIVDRDRLADAFTHCATEIPWPPRIGADGVIALDAVSMADGIMEHLRAGESR